MIDIKKPLPVDLPVLTEVVGGSAVDLPTLTEIVEEVTDSIANELSPQLIRELEAHLENIFMEKLRQHWAEAQQHATSQAVAELKNELPQLIRDALNAPHDSA